MNQSRRIHAFLAYLLSIVGWLYVLILRKDDDFAVFHAKQSMVLTTVAVGSLVVWGVVAWVLSWIPIAGPFVAAVAFSLVAWISGMIRALRGEAKPVPIVGGWSRRLSIADS